MVQLLDSSIRRGPMRMCVCFSCSSLSRDWAPSLRNKPVGQGPLWLDVSRRMHESHVSLRFSLLLLLLFSLPSVPIPTTPILGIQLDSVFWRPHLNLPIFPLGLVAAAIDLYDSWMWWLKTDGLHLQWEESNEHTHESCICQVFRGPDPDCARPPRTDGSRPWGSSGDVHSEADNYNTIWWGLQIYLYFLYFSE